MQTNAQQSAGTGPSVPMPLTAQVPVGRLMMQAEQQAAYSRTQLQEDVAALDRYNNDVNRVNDRATAALELALMDNHGPQRSGLGEMVDRPGRIVHVGGAEPRENKGPDASQATVEKRAILPAFARGNAVLDPGGTSARSGRFARETWFSRRTRPRARWPSRRCSRSTRPNRNPSRRSRSATRRSSPPTSSGSGWPAKGGPWSWI